MRCDSGGLNCVAIAGATSPSYRVVAADVGKTIESEVTAVDHAGSVGAYEGPITITSGGTISNRSFETTSATPAVTIATTQPVVFQNCRFRNLTGPGTAYMVDAYHSIPGPGIDVTFDHCQIFGGSTYQTSPRWLVAQQVKKLIVRNCTIENTRGMEIWPCDSVTSPVIQITRTRHHNIIGGATEAGLAYVGNFVQFREVVNAAIEISWCEIENEYNQSEPEDIISIYHTNNVHMFDCMLWHQSQPGNNRASSQSGITIDCSDGGSPAGSCSNILIERCQVVDAMGIFASLQYAGSNDRFLNNRVIADGKLPDGVTPVFNGFSGLDVKVGSRNAAGANNHAHGNVVGYVGTAGRQDGNLSGTPEGDTAEWLNNTHFAGTPTQSDENAEWTSWLAKKAAAGITVGA